MALESAVLGANVNVDLRDIQAASKPYWVAVLGFGTLVGGVPLLLAAWLEVVQAFGQRPISGLRDCQASDCISDFGAWLGESSF